MCEGGEYGIITKRTAPVWQFLLMDSSFEGQRAAAIKTQEAGFTLIRVSFSNMPVALQVAPGEVEQLYGRDLRMQNIREAAFVAGNARNSHSAVTLVNIACTDVPYFYEQSIKAPAKHYVVDRFSQGLMIGADGREQGIATAPPGTRARQTRANGPHRHPTDSGHGPMGQCPFAGHCR